MSAVMRAKLRVTNVQELKSPATETEQEKVTGEQLAFMAVGPSQYPEDGSDENNSYARWTPSANLTMSISNPALFGKFKQGDTFYVDFTPAE